MTRKTADTKIKISFETNRNQYRYIVCCYGTWRIDHIRKNSSNELKSVFYGCDKKNVPLKPGSK